MSLNTSESTSTSDTTSMSEEIDKENLPFWFIDDEDVTTGGTDHTGDAMNQTDTTGNKSQTTTTETVDESNALPDTGEANKSLLPSFATLLAGLGLLKRKKKEETEENPEANK
ncbi:LPXTG cell wall anchor domain-containing protein [Staphylococcus capitis]|uniref:LPXTG cell wall anchor domain-containing protein n=1 Tax=Staphylococcus capitis TaxID=29388 RepID=UPI0019553E29|nr:LPXTG cell wall anchor domain-containing protein [Staphylococcus capitis]